jgi:hypothetical protein
MVTGLGSNPGLSVFKFNLSSSTTKLHWLNMTWPTIKVSAWVGEKSFGQIVFDQKSPRHRFLLLLQQINFFNSDL